MASGVVTLTQMLNALDKNVATGIERKIKKLSKKAVFRAPLDDNKAELLKRQVGYGEVTKEVCKWDPIIEKNKKAEQIKFPLDRQPEHLPSTSDAIGELKARSEFEETVQKTLQTSDTALRDRQELTKAEEKYLKAISLEEAKARHLELQKTRVLLSSYAAKMRRQKTIKSKSYRRLLKKEKVKRHLKNVESSKDLLMDEIEKLQKLRARERATLKHKNTGKWAKHAKFRAKYDEEARKAMIEQIGIAGKLLQRPAGIEGSSDSDDDSDANSEDSEASDNHSEAGSDGSQDSVEMERRLNIIRQQSENIEDDEQRKLMSEAFADDDVVTEFKEAKEALANEEQPKDIDLFLPGWGDWAGPGLKISKKKRRRYIIKAQRRPRKDDNLGNVIISEDADSHLNGLVIKQVPRNMRIKGKLEKTMNQPVTATFIDQTTYRKVIKPKIETKMGARIEPMSKAKVLLSKGAKWA